MPRNSHLQTPGSPDEVEISGERFTFAEDGGQVFLSHPQWSLMGVGANRDEAYAALLAEARELACAMRLDPSEVLSLQARQLRDFVLRVA